MPNSTFIRTVKAIHSGADYDPQYAEITGHEENEVIHYVFRLQQWKFGQEHQYASGISRKLSGAEVSVDVIDYALAPAIEVSYTPKDRRELGSIKRFFDGIPLDGGEMPRKGATFFPYD